MGIFRKLFGGESDNAQKSPSPPKGGISLAGLKLVLQGDCGYFVDDASIVRALWVSKSEIAGANGHLRTTLHLLQTRGELSDIPASIFLALQQESFFCAENKSFGDVGGYIVLFDKHMLPQCGRARPGA